MQTRRVLALLLLVGLVAIGARFVGRVQPTVALAATLCLCGAVVAFLRTEMAIYFLIAAMLLSPQVSVGRAVLTRDRGLTLRLDDLFIVVISATWFLKNAFYKELSLVRRTPLNGAIWMYTTACIFSTMIGILAGNVDLRSGAFFILKYIEYFVLFWMIVNTTQDEGQIRRYLVLVLAVALIVSVIGIAQIPSGQRVSAPFEGEKGEPNTFGGYVLLIVSIIMGLVCCTKEYRKTLLLIGGVMMVAFLYTLSRASYLALLPVLFTVPWLTRRKKLWIPVILVAFTVMIFPRFLPQAVVNRMEYTFAQPAQRGQVKLLGKRLDTSTSARYSSFVEAIDAFFKRPLFGYGVTGWGFIDSQYFRTLVDTGIVGLTTFLYLIYRIMQMAFRTRAHFSEGNSFYFGLSSGFIAGTFGLLVHAIGSNTFIIVRIMEPYWILCAMVLMLPELVPQPLVVKKRF